MAPRPYWKGYLKVALVNCPVTLSPVASDASKIRFHTINRATGNRVETRYIDAETGKPVDPEDEVKGYEIGEDKPEEVRARPETDAQGAPGRQSGVDLRRAPQKRRGREKETLIRTGTWRHPPRARRVGSGIMIKRGTFSPRKSLKRHLTLRMAGSIRPPIRELPWRPN
jgi:hypothetical protein